MQCVAATEAIQNISDCTMCRIRHTTDHGTPTIHVFPMKTSLNISSQPGTVHDFELSVMVQDHLLIRETVRRAGWLYIAIVVQSHLVQCVNFCRAFCYRIKSNYDYFHYHPVPVAGFDTSCIALHRW